VGGGLRLTMKKSNWLPNSSEPSMHGWIAFYQKLGRPTMEHEFNNRITAQREILKIINRKSWPTEDLFSISNKAINRWVTINQLNPQAPIIRIVNEVAGKLFFLANKSQEQISEKYQLIKSELMEACGDIERELKLANWK
jgi:hypothetical protein